MTTDCPDFSDEAVVFPGLDAVPAPLAYLQGRRGRSHEGRGGSRMPVRKPATQQTRRSAARAADRFEVGSYRYFVCSRKAHTMPSPL